MIRNKFNFDELRDKIIAENKKLPLILANDAKNYFLKSFKDQGFEGKKWQEVKRRMPDENEYKRSNPSARTRAILQGKGSGRLRKDVANMVQTGHSITNGYVLVVKNPYAQIHNEGLSGMAWGKHPFTMPKRQFVGDTPTLRKFLQDKLKKIINKILKS